LRTALFCPFTAGTVLWQAESGAWTLSVCVRGTFSFVQGREAVLADVQEPVTADVHAGGDPRASVVVPSDLVPYKPRVDVVLVGSAYAPHEEPVEALVARLAVGSLDKAIGIIGDRTWIDGPDGLEPSAPKPFRSMPLAYERAARGRDNPHGFDLTAAPRKGALALPNLEAVDDGAGLATAGFGPLAPTAGTRRALLRPTGWTWIEGGARGRAPAGLDFHFFNAAPRDQQLAALRAGDRLVLENLNREHARLETHLPSVRPRAFLVPPEVDRGFEIPLRVDTLWIDCDRGVLTLSWRGLATVDTPDEDALGSVVVAAESKGREVGYAQIVRLVRDGGMTSTDSDTFSGALPDQPAAGTLQFGEGRGGPALADPPSDIDSDLVPTPGPFRPKRPLPEVGGGAVLIKQAALADPLRADDELSIDDPKTVTRTGPAPSDASFAEEAPTRQIPKLDASAYATIAVGVERGDAVRALARFGLSPGDMPGVQRSCSERQAREPAFALAFAAALELARRA
jgi:hypothetical protein